MVKEAILYKYGAVKKKLSKGKTLLQEGDLLVHYYQVLTGEIRLINYNSKGKEMIQGIFSKGEGFGSPAIISDFPSCSNAEATKQTQLLCLEKNSFLKMLQENNDISFIFLQHISKR